MNPKKNIIKNNYIIQEYTLKEILELRGARIFIMVTAGTSAMGLLFQFLAGHGAVILLPTVILYSLAIYFSYRLYLRKKRKAASTVYASIVGFIMFMIPLLAWYNYALTVDWLYAAGSSNINWLLMANLVAFQFLYDKKLYRFMMGFVLINIVIFHIFAFYNGVPMPFYTYTDGRVNYGVMSSRAIFTVIMMFIVSYLSYRNILEIEQFDLLAASQADTIKAQSDEHAMNAEEIQSQYEELEAQYEEIEQMNEEMISAQSEIMEINSSLRQEKEKLAVTLQSVAQGIVEVDTALIVDMINDGAADMLGLPADRITGKYLPDILKVKNSDNAMINLGDIDFLNGSVQFDLYNSAVLTGGEGDIDVTIRAVPVRIPDGAVCGYVITIEDVTELKKMRQHLISSSRLESLGIFAGGIAHDINNFFTGMLGCIALAKRGLKENSADTVKYLDDAEITALKARGLAEQLLTFSKGGDPVKKVISMNAILGSGADFILSGSNIVCLREFDPDLKLIEADETQVSQVVNNILINAVQAMPDGGSLHIKSVNRHLGKGNLYSLPPGEYVEVTVEDEGPGIEHAMIQRIFDPFVTTKNDGSGLGLSVAYSVLKKHGGSISVSNSDRGAVFVFVIPVSAQQVLHEEDICRDEILFCGKVLLMDDDDMIRTVGEALLKSFGFEVVSAAEGGSAVKLFSEEVARGGCFDLVILDLTIKGGTGGLEAFREMKKIDPAVKGIVSSGYSHDPVMSNFQDYGFTAVLKKPYNFEELGDVIRMVSALKDSG